MAQTCTFRLGLNHPASIWYAVLATIIQSYLLFLAMQRYRLYTEMQWPSGVFPRLWLTVYIAIVATCIPLLALFLTFGILKTGNIAGDNEQLARRTRRTIELISGGVGVSALRRRTGFVFRLCHLLKSIWQHFPPLPQTIHLLTSFLQLFAQQIMMAQLYRFGFINSGDFLNTELDFIFQRARQLATNLPIGDTRLQGFRITSEELSESAIAPNVLPILMHARLFGIPLEFVNLLVALIAFTIVYPAVFWRLNKWFAFILSLFLFVQGASLIFDYISFTILFRIQETNFYSLRPVGIGQILWPLRPLYVLHPMALVGSFWLTALLMFFASAILYAYGYGKYRTSLMLYRRRLKMPNQCNAATEAPEYTGCDGYTPNALIIFVLAAITLTRAPTVYALMLLYQNDAKPILGACLLIDVFYLFYSIIFWLVLTCKRQWTMKIMHNVYEILSLQNAQHTATGPSARNRTPMELKNALILMHGEHMFVTDDPMAKPVIMRSLMKMCASGSQPLPDDIYWLRSSGGQSPRRSRDEGVDRRGGSVGTLTWQRGPGSSVRNTPEIGGRERGSRGRIGGDEMTQQGTTCLLEGAASSLPLETPYISQQAESINTFGTLQRMTKTRQSEERRQQNLQNDYLYGSKANATATPYTQHYGTNQPPIPGTLSRSCIQQGTYQCMTTPVENFTSLNRPRRPSKSSTNANASSTYGNGNRVGVFQASPQFPRNNVINQSDPSSNKLYGGIYGGVGQADSAYGSVRYESSIGSDNHRQRAGILQNFPITNFDQMRNNNNNGIYGGVGENDLYGTKKFSTDQFAIPSEVMNIKSTLPLTLSKNPSAPAPNSQKSCDGSSIWSYATKRGATNGYYANKMNGLATTPNPDGSDEGITTPTGSTSTAPTSSSNLPQQDHQLADSLESSGFQLSNNSNHSGINGIVTSTLTRRKQNSDLSGILETNSTSLVNGFSHQENKPIKNVGKGAGLTVKFANENNEQQQFATSMV